MNIEDYREYCLSIGDDIEEKLPFTKFKSDELINESPKHWIGIDPNTAPDDLLKELTQNSYEIVKAKYKKLEK